MIYDVKNKEYISLIENTLYKELSGSKVADAMRYSLEAGGKRIRPVLTLAFCESFGGNLYDALNAAVALEYIHTSSLIHDDLPAMDDDDFRRGKPSCHKAFPEATAILAGDALITEAFGIAASSKNGAILVKEISTRIGIAGMIGGQQLDITYEMRKPDINELLQMYKMKTSALISAACKCGVIAADGSQEDIRNADEFGENLGLAFQIIDDILDVNGDERELGKPIGSDESSGKTTSVTLLGLEGAEMLAKEYTDNAMKKLINIPNNEFIKTLTLSLLGRKK